jgi:hypothetical protein
MLTCTCRDRLRSLPRGWLLLGLLAGVALALAAASPAEAGTKKYYLTPDTFDGNEALTACASGFHMASLWEIFNTTAVKYDTSLGFTQADSGSGPPAGVFGWIRTGFGAAGSTGPGVGNCNAWTSDSSGLNGTVVDLNTSWSGTVAVISPWAAIIQTCNNPFRVWCSHN